MMKNINDYFDSYGLLGQKDLFTNQFDSGDSMQRTGFYLIPILLLGLPPHNEIDPSQHELGSTGIYVRHPGPGWWSDPRNCSRDQFKPIIVALGLLGRKWALKRLLARFLSRGMFSQNTKENGINDTHKIPDFMGPAEWGNFIRAFKSKLFYPFLFICDLGILVNVLIRVYKGRKDLDDVGDDLNLLVDLAQAQFVLPTPISHFSRKFYFKYRVWSKQICGPQYALDWYFRQNEAPPLNDVWRPLLEKMK